eukprot:RCo000094
MASAEAAAAFAQKLEAFMLSKAEEVSRFVHDKLQVNVVAPCGATGAEDQPVELFLGFQEYARFIDGLLSEFLAAEGTELVEASRHLGSLPAEQRETLASSDYIAAALEYTAFVKLLHDIRGIYDL